MRVRLRQRTRALFGLMHRKYTHVEMIRTVVRSQAAGFHPHPVFVETGSGISTTALAELARECDGTVYTCDVNENMLAELKSRAGRQLDGVVFMAGDSIESLEQIVKKHERIDFAFLDSAASAMHTFREFQVIEPCLKEGACLLIDNAALPGTKWLLSPCRKGKILVPYLLASEHWKVQGQPYAGDSMVTATYCDEPVHADPDYERPEHIEYWPDHFEKHLP